MVRRETREATARVDFDDSFDLLSADGRINEAETRKKEKKKQEASTRTSNKSNSEAIRL